MPSSTCCEAGAHPAMTSTPSYRIVHAPRLGTNDDSVRVLTWAVTAGQRVEATTAILVVETTKASVEIEAESAGYVFPLVDADSEVAVGAALAIVADTPDRPTLDALHEAPTGDQRGDQRRDQIVTRSARGLIEQHGLTLEPFAALAVVRTSDVEAYLASHAAGASGAAATPTAEEEAEWVAALSSPLYRDVQALLSTLRARMHGRFDRHVPTGTLLGDRWQLAKDYGFGEGTSIYDECLIKGPVRIGRHCWVGPYTILDGQHAALAIGDHVDIGSGAHLYTHDSIERALTGGLAPLATGAVTIGNCCFIAPMVSIGPGTTIGDHSFVAAGSFVQGTFKPYSYIAGNPARCVGTVEISGHRARLRRA
jgi:acetyltransferase-like isoleucine patch superfamily enzyme